MNKVAGFVKTAGTGSLVSEKPMATDKLLVALCFAETRRRF
jgi:hypothetical protein